MPEVPAMHLGDPLTWMVGIIGIAVLTLVVIRPEWGITVSILGMALAPTSPGQEQAVMLYLWVFFNLFLFAALLFRLLVLPSERMRLPQWQDKDVRWAILIFLALVIASMPVSFIYNSDFSLAKRFELYLRGGSAFFFLGFYFLFRHYIRDAGQGVRWLVCLVIAGFVIWARSLVLWVQNPTVLRVTRVFDIARFEYFSLGFIIAVVFFLHYKKKWVRILAVLLCLAFAHGMAISGARAQVLAALAGVGVVWVWKVFELQAARRLTPRIVLVPILILTVAGGLLQFIGSQDERLSRFWRYQLSSSATGQKRFQEVQESIGHFMDSPVFGKGLGYARYTRMEYGIGLKNRERIGFVHNSLAYLLLTMGALGLLSYLWMFWAWAKILWRNRYKWCTDPVVVACSACVASLIVSGSFRATFKHFQFNLLLSLFWALSLTVPMMAEWNKGAVAGEADTVRLPGRT